MPLWRTRRGRPGSWTVVVCRISQLDGRGVVNPVLRKRSVGIVGRIGGIRREKVFDSSATGGRDSSGCEEERQGWDPMHISQFDINFEVFVRHGAQTFIAAF